MQVDSCVAEGHLEGATFTARTEAPGTWIYQQCLRCGLARLRDAPPSGDLTAYYASSYEPGSADFASGRPTLMSRLLQANFDRIGRNIERLTERGSVLDVGCGSGVFLGAMRRRGWSVVGVEPNRARAEALRERQRLDVRADSLESLPPSLGRFDAVTLFDVVEHLADPRSALANARALLAPGGVLVVSTPNVRSWEHRLFGPRWFALQPPDHRWLFSAESLASLLRSSGFEPVISAISPVSYVWPSLRLQLGVGRQLGIADAVLKGAAALPAALLARMTGEPAQLEIYSRDLIGS